MGIGVNDRPQKSVKTSMMPTQSLIELMIQDAVKGPSGDNAQPWKFHWNGQRLLVLHAEKLAEHSLNRHNHASMIACGALLEALRISATRFGLHTQVKLSLKNNGALASWAEVEFLASDLDVSPLASQIGKRTTDRRVYKGGNISAELAAQIKQIESEFPGCHVRFQSQQTQSFMSYFIKTEKLLWKNKKIVADLTKWMRLSEKEICNSQDGMSWRNMGMNATEAGLFRLIRRFPLIPSLLWSLGFGAKIKLMGKQAIQSSAALVCFSVDNLSADSFCKLGQMAYRTWLLLNANGFGVQPLSYSSSSVADVESGELLSFSKDEYETFKKGKAIVQENFGMESNEIPVWTFRTGLSTVLPKENQTSRRPVSSFMLSTNFKGQFDYELAFSRNLGWVTHQEQEKIRGARVAIAGQGGVGGLHLLTLVRLGVTKFHIADMDTFGVENFNRQAGASMNTLGRSKVDVMAEQALAINPELEIVKFSEGVNRNNMSAFLKDVDVYIDGLDAFVLDVRAEVFAACREREIPAVTVAPIGMGAALLAFLPGQMSFEQYFGFNNAKSELEKIGRFILGLTPSGTHIPAIADRSAFRLTEKRGGSTSMGCSLATGVMGAEVLKIILQRGQVHPAPHGLHFDAYRNKYRKTWMPFGEKNFIFRLKLLLFNKIFMKQTSEVPAIDRGVYDQRFLVSLPVQIEGGARIETVNISQNGLKTVSDSGVFQQDGIFDVTVKVEEKSIQLRLQSIWRQAQGEKVHRGFQILKPSQEWQELLTQIKSNPRMV